MRFADIMRCGCAEFRTPRACHVIGPVTIQLRDASADGERPPNRGGRIAPRLGGAPERVVSRLPRPYFRRNAAIPNAAIPNAAIPNAAIQVIP